MKTEATEEFPEIEWDQESLSETDIDERLEIWHMAGTGTDGQKYIGSGYYIHGELDSIKEIELED